ncbi:MAG: hypothetical protein FJ308_22510, partial [Planctomycetes bacterium]|nr:hypothetical protein [Planctomycetota bacterium]
MMEKARKIFSWLCRPKHPTHFAPCIARLKGALSCLALAVLVLIPLWENLLFSEPVFNHLRPTPVDYFSGLVLVGLVSFLVALVFQQNRKLPAKVRKRVGIIVLGFLLIAGVFNPLRHYVSNHYLPRDFQHLFWFKALPVLIGFGLVLAARRAYLLLWKLVLFTSPFALIVVGRLLGGLVGGVGREITVHQLDRLPENSHPSNRVVWIVFDELDYRLSFPERPKEIRLPNFDRFASSSFRFTNAIPPAVQTLFSVPSLVDGEVYVAAFPTGPNQLMLRDTEGVLLPWGSRSNVFTDVNALGGHVAVVGWYLPYGRVFRNVVNYSQWVAHSPKRFIGLGLDLPSTLVAHLRGILPLVRKSFHRETQQELEANLER